MFMTLCIYAQLDDVARAWIAAEAENVDGGGLQHLCRKMKSAGKELDVQHA
jgi:hypothetical protein